MNYKYKRRYNQQNTKNLIIVYYTSAINSLSDINWQKNKKTKKLNKQKTVIIYIYYKNKKNHLFFVAFGAVLGPIDGG